MTTKPKPPPASAASSAESPSPETTPVNNKTDRPVRYIKIGRVQIAIWRNLTAEGQEVFNATAERLYKDEQTGKWDSSSSFGRRDMLELAKAVDIAHTVMSELSENANRRASSRPFVNGASVTR